MVKRAVLSLCALFLLLIAPVPAYSELGLGTDEPIPTATATPSSTASPSPSPTVSPSATAKPTSTPSPAIKATVKPIVKTTSTSPTPAMTPSPSLMPTSQPSATAVVKAAISKPGGGPNILLSIFLFLVILGIAVGGVFLLRKNPKTGVTLKK
ncbi:MAG: hypothetical protein M3Q44_04720 [bacterium]|nr:hypothetical protein [bacterium]